DQGSVDAGCYGSDVETPSIDRLAREGIRFTRFYSGAPVCSPSRASLLTGSFTPRAGLTSNAGSSRGDRGMPGDRITMAEVFRRAGYRTAHVGKWHLGWTEETDPLAQGFDHSFGHMGGCIDNWSHFFYWNGPNRHDLWRDREEVHEGGAYFPDLMLREAFGVVDASDERPFFMYFACNVPHYPYQGDASWLEHYEGMPAPRNLYAAFLSTIDDRVGRLLDHLDERGRRDDTIIVFQSDHGHSVETRAFGGGGDAGPYRGHKFTMFEGGIRVPAIISWPGHLPEGAVRDEAAHASDWLPTLASLCGIEITHAIDGMDLAPALREGTPLPRRVLHWQTGEGDRAQWAVMEGMYKLIGNANHSADRPNLSDEDRVVFLSDLATDLGETRNHASAHPEIVERLRAAREAYLATLRE
ncbi:MAG: sulfatase-like hydrolase/transferase, partial [Phycisphaerales bacterium]|nr:sulfatase-like hydrolase/transferase [Phycisphaerales bacterium]